MGNADYLDLRFHWKTQNGKRYSEISFQHNRKKEKPTSPTIKRKNNST
jgi:hypothetical protein